MIDKNCVMKVGYLVKINKELLKLLSNFDIKISDVKYVELYEDFCKLQKDNKITYVVEVLAEKYHISIASVYRILKRFGETIKEG